MIGSEDQTIGVVVSRRTPLANVEAFEAALDELRQISSKQAGHIACDVLRGAVARGAREYFVAYRFADEAGLRAWEGSPERPKAKSSARRVSAMVSSGPSLPSGAILERRIRF